MGAVSRFLGNNLFRPEDVPRFEAKLFFEGERNRPYLERFFVLLILATIIATAGVLADSTATVIGAMIVAPLMTPIMATAAALVMANMARAVNRLLLVAIGVATVILLSMIIGYLYSGIILFDENTQILARVSPKLIDLLAALASGAAGAFCLSREDVADSLPGVAIAISLVPPLCVVGIAISAGEWAAASGAMLLFVTNFLAILLAGGAVLALLGLNRAAMIEVRGPARRNAFTLVLLAAILVAIPLILTGRQATLNALTEIQAREAVEDWTAGKGLELRALVANSDQVYVVLVGPGTTPGIDTLFAEVEESVGRPLDITAELVPAQSVSNRPRLP